MERLIEILPPIEGSKLRRQWISVIGGVEFKADSEDEARKKAFDFVIHDPLIEAWFTIKLAAETIGLQEQIRLANVDAVNEFARANDAEERLRVAREALMSAPAVPDGDMTPVEKALHIAIAMADWYNGPRSKALATIEHYADKGMETK